MEKNASGIGLVTKSRLTLVTPWAVARQAPLSVGFSRQEYWSGSPFPSPGELPDPGIKLTSQYPCLHAKLLQSYPALRDPVDCSPPGSSVRGVLQARTLEWVAISFSTQYPYRWSVTGLDVAAQLFCLKSRDSRLKHEL